MMIEETGRYEPNNHHPLATRYEKRAANYRAMVVIASLMIWLSS